MACCDLASLEAAMEKAGRDATRATRGAEVLSRAIDAMTATEGPAHART